MVVQDPGDMTKIFHSLRHKNGNLSYITDIGNFKITRIKDVSLNYDSKVDEIPEDRIIPPSSEMITFELDNSIVATLRGSGTEPKLKYYIEATGKTMEECRSKALAVEHALQDEVLKLMDNR